MFGPPPIDGCRSADGPRHALAGFLRRLALRLDPSPPEPPADMVPISREKLREIQMTGLQMIRDFAFVSREQGPGTGLLWFPPEILRSITWLITTELALRESDFAAIEQNPRTALR